MDGTVGTNGITDKYPTLMEYIAEWLNKLLSFPYLDLMIAVSYWDVMPYEVLESGYNSPLWDQHLYEYEDWDERFYESVEIGICVHDKVIEILSPAKAVAKYKEYAALYEKNREIYVSDYYMEHGIEQVNLTYLKRCIESYGLDADKELSKVREYIWKGRK